MKLNHVITSIAAALAFASATPEAALAVPAYPRPVTVTQADGSTLTIQQVGDEFAHYTVDVNNNLLVDVNGVYQYGKLDGAGKVVASGVKATMRPDAAERGFLSSIDTKAVVTAARSEMVNNGNLRRAYRSMQQAAVMRAPQKAVTLPSGLVMPRFTGMLTTDFPSTGKQKALVILVQFTDTKFKTTYDAHDYFSRMVNQEGFSDNGCWGSARDYFLNSSGGRFDCDFDVYGPVTLTHNMAYYGGNDRYGQDKLPHMMVVEACRMLDDEVDFTQYDRDGNGVIDNVFVFYAGMGEATGGGTNTVWPHSFDVRYCTDANGNSLTNVRLDGKLLGNYACSNEWIQYVSPARPDAIGTFVHEFSHVMGLPDLYTTNESSSFTPGDWSILDSGPYLNDGLCPPAYSSFERLSMGWLEPVVLNGPANCTLNAIDKNEAYCIPTERPTEFFLLENRQREGIDKYLPGHGMLVWHIDFNSTTWINNSVNNNPSHQYVDIVEANNQTSEGFMSTQRGGNTFPGTKVVTSFTAETTPALRSWSGKKIELPITNIIESSKVITFKVAGGALALDKPQVRPVTNLTPRSATLHWSAVDNAEAYDVSLLKVDDSLVHAQWFGYRLTGTSLDVDSLEPETAYRVLVKAYANNGMTESEPSDEYVFTTADLTFDYIIPTAYPATTQGNQFVASWQAVEGATDYLLSVYTKEVDNIATDLVNFDNMKVVAQDMPQGWTTTATTTYSLSTYSVVAPALRVKVGQYVESPVYPGDITGISLYTRTSQAACASNRVVVMLLVDGEWSEVATLTPTTTVQKLSVETPIPAGARAVRILYDGTNNTDIAFDDIEIQYVGNTRNVAHADFDAKNVGNVTSFNITGLDLTKRYYYVVSATNGTMTSLPSAEIEVMTGSGIADTVVAPAVGPARYYNMQGIEVSADALTPGLYIERRGTVTTKIIIR